MKKYEVVEFAHIKPNWDILKWKSSKDIIIDNLTNQIPLLHEYNNEWYNIYKTFNTFFDWKRRTDHINELKTIFIDMDYKWKNKENYLSLRKKCKVLEHEYWIYPFEINETYKGYHLLFSINPDLYYIKNEYYLDIASALIEYFDWDKLAKQITGLYKMIWFIDHKEKRNFLIENKFSATNQQKENLSIDLNTLKKFWTIPENFKIKDILKDSVYGIKVKWNKEWKIDYSKFQLEQNEKLLKLSNIIDKKTWKQDIYEIIENIDWRKFIDAINDYQNWVFKWLNVIINWKDIDNTHGLKLYFNNWKFEIKDFAGKKRFWNRLFLLNHVLWLNTEKSIKKKKEKLFSYMSFLRERFGIIFNKSITWFYINSKLIYDYLQDNIEIKDELLLDLIHKYKIKTFDLKDKQKYLNSVIYLYIFLEKFRQIDFLNVGNISLWFIKLLNLLEITDSYENRKKVKFILELWTKLELEFDYYNSNQKHIKTKKRLYNISINKDNSRFNYNPIIWNINTEKINVSNSFILFNEKIFYSKWIFWKTYLKFMIYCIYNVKKFGTLKFSINQVKKILWWENNNYTESNYMSKKINSYLAYMRKTKLIWYVKKNKNTYTIWKKYYNKEKKYKMK